MNEATGTGFGFLVSWISRLLTLLYSLGAQVEAFPKSCFIKTFKITFYRPFLFLPNISTNVSTKCFSLDSYINFKMHVTIVRYQLDLNSSALITYPSIGCILDQNTMILDMYNPKWNDRIRPSWIRKNALDFFNQARSNILAIESEYKQNGCFI